MTNHSALARSWRPLILKDVIGQELTVKALTNALDHQILHHAYLFTGTRGVGKTSLARILAKSMNCQAGTSANACLNCDSCLSIASGYCMDVIEIDAASRTKVEDTRELLEQTQFHPIKGKYKIFIIDEVHMLSGHSFNALLKTLEEPPAYVKFLLATTELDKVPATIRSRCIHFPLQNISNDILIDYLGKKLKTMNIEFEQPSLNMIAQQAAGSVRDALTLLEKLLLLHPKELKSEAVAKTLGLTGQKNIHDLIFNAMTGRLDALKMIFTELKLNQTNYLALIEQALYFVHQEALKPLSKQQSQFDESFLQLAYDIFIKALENAKFTPNQAINFEMTFLRLTRFTPTVNEQPATAQSNVSNELTHSTWTKLLPNLKLNGMSLALAKALTVISHQAHQLNIQLPPNLKSLANDNTQSNLIKCIQDHGFLVQNLNIQWNEAKHENSQDSDKQNAEALCEQLKNHLKKHPQTSALLQTLQADIDALNLS
ncbi:MAG: DNA polymerase III subunit gamma/tau [Gammaproteobacteria bacterium]|nr:DNA polymerase III subunit gamma/tau [Gammaproteobacteria bacterium]